MQHHEPRPGFIPNDVFARMTLTLFLSDEEKELGLISLETLFEDEFAKPLLLQLDDIFKKKKCEENLQFLKDVYFLNKQTHLSEFELTQEMNELSRIYLQQVAFHKESTNEINLPNVPDTKFDDRELVVNNPDEIKKTHRRETPLNLGATSLDYINKIRNKKGYSLTEMVNSPEISVNVIDEIFKLMSQNIAPTDREDLKKNTLKYYMLKSKPEPIEIEASCSLFKSQNTIYANAVNNVGKLLEEMSKQIMHDVARVELHKNLKAFEVAINIIRKLESANTVGNSKNLTEKLTALSTLMREAFVAFEFLAENQRKISNKPNRKK